MLKPEINARLLTNHSGGHEAEIVSGIKSASRVIIHTAFMKSSGLSRLEGSLKKAISAGTEVLILVGQDLFTTEPRALWTLYEMMSGHKNATLLLASQHKSTFHPKLYYWEKGKQTTVAIGSANLTGGGLKDNLELSVLIQLGSENLLLSELKTYFDMIHSSERVKTANRIMLSQYERKYEIANKKMKDAKEEVSREISKLFDLDEETLQICLTEYNNNNYEQNSYKEKIDKYQEAKILLDKLISSRVMNKQRFLITYEKLVGGKGVPQLWRSGSINRSKNEVASQYNKFITMLRALKADIEKAPDVVFDIGLKHIRKIDGLGVNVLTEIMNTYAPRKFAVLNKNPIASLKYFGLQTINNTNKMNISAAKYTKYNSILSELANLCKFQNYSQVDHFLNFVYWDYVKENAEEA